MVARPTYVLLQVVVVVVRVVVVVVVVVAVTVRPGWAWISRKWQTAIAGPAVPARMGYHRQSWPGGGRRTQRQPGWCR